MYIPPGIVIDKLKKFSAEIRMAIPQDNVYIRKKEERTKLPNKDGKSSKAKSVTYNQSVKKTTISGQDAKKEPHPLEEQFDKENGNNVDFEKLFQDNLPPEAIDLQHFVAGIKDKDPNKDKDLEKIQKNARDHLNRVVNLVPQSNKNVSFSAMRLDHEMDN